MIRLKFVILFVSLLLVNLSFATHNRGGEITYIHLSGLTYEFTITTCTDIGSSTDRDELYIDFNLGTLYAERDTFQRATFTPFPFNHQKNVYIGTHTFTSSGSHRITIEDPNRNAGILNIYPTGGNSDEGSGSGEGSCTGSDGSAAGAEGNSTGGGCSAEGAEGSSTRSGGGSSGGGSGGSTATATAGSTSGVGTCCKCISTGVAVEPLVNKLYLPKP